MEVILHFFKALKFIHQMICFFYNSLYTFVEQHYLEIERMIFMEVLNYQRRTHIHIKMSALKNYKNYI